MSEKTTNINWFPGHMTKAKREMEEKIKLVDMIVELRDGRIPFSSANPLLEQITNNKPRLIILSKSDKADKKETEKWLKYFESKGIRAIALDLIHNKNLDKKISDECTTIMAAKINKLKAKGLKNVEIRAMVVGIPNVGKSTMINSVSKRKIAKTADHPGVTKSLQWIKVSPAVSFLDTPGVLWPKFEDQKVGFLLAVTGAINDNILPLGEIVEFAIDFLMKHHPEKLTERYGIEVKGDVHEVIDAIGKSRNCFLQNEEIDYARLNKLILKDIRDNQISNVTWEIYDETDTK